MDKEREKIAEIIRAHPSASYNDHSLDFLLVAMFRAFKELGYRKPLDRPELEKIVIELIAADEGMTTDEATDFWNRWKVELKKNPEHFGDCTKQPQTCNRCLIEDYYRQAGQILALFRLPEKPPLLNDEEIGRAIMDAYRELCVAKGLDPDDIETRSPNGIVDYNIYPDFPEFDINLAMYNRAVAQAQWDIWDEAIYGGE